MIIKIVFSPFFPVSLKFLHLSSACFVVVAKSRINNVCVSFSRRLSCNNRSEDFRATLAEFRAQYWGEIVGAGFVESGKTLLRSIGKKWEGNL